MIIVRRSGERRHIENKDQNTWMTFDRENKNDLLKNGFGSLILLNEEILSRDRALLFRPLHDLVIVTYVQKGVVVYHGPLGGSDLLEAGDFHRINVAPGAAQHEFDSIMSGDARIFQSGFTPGTEAAESKGKKIFIAHADRHGIFKLIASPDGREDSLPIQRDVHMFSSFIHQGNHISHPLKHGRSVWLHVVIGRIQVKNFVLQTGDGAGFTGENSVSLTAQEPCEVLLYDLPESVVKENITERQKEAVYSQS